MSLYHMNLYSVMSAFVQSRLSNMTKKLQNTPSVGASAAMGVGGGPPGAGGAAQETQARSLCVFDATYFSRLLQEALRRAPAPSYDEVYELAKLCSLRLSFVKGWDAEYHRQVRCLSH